MNLGRISRIYSLSRWHICLALRLPYANSYDRVAVILEIFHANLERVIFYFNFNEIVVSMLLCQVSTYRWFQFLILFHVYWLLSIIIFWCVKYYKGAIISEKRGPQFLTCSSNCSNFSRMPQRKIFSIRNLWKCSTSRYRVDAPLRPRQNG